MSKDTLTVTDNRTGKTYEIAIENGAIKALDLRQIKTGPDDFGMMTYDPALTNTASCKSRITFIDGDRGILDYRGYPIEQLAEQASFLETAFLILSRRAAEAGGGEDVGAQHHPPHDGPREHPRSSSTGSATTRTRWACSCRTVAALSTFYPEAKGIHDRDVRQKQVFRLIAKMPTLAAFALPPRHGPAVRVPGQRPQLLRELPEDDVLHARSATTSRTPCSRTRWTCSSSSTPTTSRTARPTPCGRWAPREVDPYSATAAAIAALYGPCTAGPTSRCCGCCGRSGRRTGSPPSSRT